jgi:hypothetical protein
MSRVVWCVLPLLLLVVGCEAFLGFWGNSPNQGGDSVGQLLPESVSLDVAEFADGGGAGLPYANEMPQEGSVESIGRESTRTLNQLDEIMRRFSQINPLITDPNVTQVSGTILWDTRVEGATQGPNQSRLPNPGAGTGEERLIKIDFAAFDFNGDGANEGSGLPLQAPVALRVWVTDGAGEFKPAACGLVTALATDDNAGAGALLTLSYARNAAGDIAIIQWSQADPSDKRLWSWDEHPGMNGWGYSAFLVQHRVVGDLLEKTVKSNIDDNSVEARYYETASAGYCREGGGPPVYLLLSDFSPATDADAQYVSTDDFDQLVLPNPNLFPWPDTFPLTPTF